MTLALQHITLQTGDLRESPRNEVSPEALAASAELLLAALAGQPAELPDADVLRFQIWGPEFPRAGGGYSRRSLVWCSVARRDSPAAAAEWAEQRAGEHDPDWLPQTLAAPWLAVHVFADALTKHPDTTAWLGDYDRCIAWAWLAR